MVSLNDLEVNKGHFENQAIVAYIIVKYRNSVCNDENGILKENDPTVTSYDLQGQRTFYVMVHGRIWLLGLYFELFSHNNNNSYQGLTCAGAAGKNHSKKLLRQKSSLSLHGF